MITRSRVLERPTSSNQAFRRCWTLRPGYGGKISDNRYPPLINYNRGTRWMYTGKGTGWTEVPLIDVPAQSGKPRHILQPLSVHDDNNDEQEGAAANADSMSPQALLLSLRAPQAWDPVPAVRKPHVLDWSCRLS